MKNILRHSFNERRIESNNVHIALLKIMHGLNLQKWSHADPKSSHAGASAANACPSRGCATTTWIALMVLMKKHAVRVYSLVITYSTNNFTAWFHDLRDALSGPIATSSNNSDMIC